MEPECIAPGISKRAIAPGISKRAIHYSLAEPKMRSRDRLSGTEMRSRNQFSGTEMRFSGIGVRSRQVLSEVAIAYPKQISLDWL